MAELCCFLNYSDADNGVADAAFHTADLALQAFKNYDEAGAVRRIQCLKYLVLATMLNQSDVDPFDAQVCSQSFALSWMLSLHMSSKWPHVWHSAACS